MRGALGRGPAAAASLTGGSRRSTTSLLPPLLLLRRSLLLLRTRRAVPDDDQPNTMIHPRRAAAAACLAAPAIGAAAAAAAARDNDTDANDANDASTTTQTLPTLNDQNIALFLSRHCPEITLIPRDSWLAQDPTQKHVAKSIILSAKGLGPILVVARLCDRVDERLVATHLGLARRAVRLATPAEALEWGGFVVGTVPPIGHRSPLRTLIDVGITRAGFGADAAVFGGGGREGVEMRAPLAALLRASCAEVGAFAGAGRSSGGSMSSSSSLDEEAGGGSGKNNSSSRAPPSLPLPWPPGSDFVHLVATVTSRRRVARTLMFATLAAEGEAHEQGRGIGGGGGKLPTAAAKPPRARPWARPDGGAAAELQAIAGKTLEAALGADALARLLASVRPGCVVAVTGRVQQPQQQQRGEEETGGAAAAAAATKTTTAQQQQQQHLELVAWELEVLHASLAERDAALRAAELRTGLQPRSLRSARDLLLLRRAEEEEEDGASATDEFARAFGMARGGGGEDPTPALPLSPPLPASAASAEDNDDDHKDDTDDNAPPSASSSSYYRMPFPDESAAVALVTDVAGVKACATALRAAELEQRTRWQQEAASPAPLLLSSRFLLSESAAVVGIDAEWRPYGSSGSGSSGDDGSSSSGGSAAAAARSPVALLQIALRDRVFLLDLPALLFGGGRVGKEEDAGHQSQQSQPPPLTPAERAVDRLLSDLLSSPWLVKAGFGLAHDLRRLADSYPRLPCFAPAEEEAAAADDAPAAAAPPPLPIVSHVDLALLARAVLPQLAYKQAAASQKSLGPVPSLSRLCEAALDDEGEGGKTTTTTITLDKRMQRSDWESRPLSAAQRTYAAADAHVLTAIFDALVRRAAFLPRVDEEGGEDDDGDDDAAVRALDGGLRRVPRARPQAAIAVATTKATRRRKSKRQG